MPVYKDEKKGTWYAAFYYKDWTGVTKHTCKRGFKTKREAKDYEDGFRNQLLHSTDITFESLVTQYMKDMTGRLKPTTLSSKQYIYDTKLTPYFGKMKIKDIDVITIRNWQNLMLNYKDENGEPYAPTYLKTLQIQLSAIFNYAMKNYAMDMNPCKIAGSIGKSRADERPFWTKEQYDAFSKAEKKPAFKVAFDILFYTGIRSGELLALTGEDVLPDRRLNICKNFQVVNGQEMFLVPKTERSKRKITIPDFLYEELQEYISGLYGFKPKDRIFYFTKSALGREIHRCADLAGLPHITVHGLRHSHASLLIHMGINIKEISQRLGHESVTTTWDTYSHLYPDNNKQLADQLQALKTPGEDNLTEPENNS